MRVISALFCIFSFGVFSPAQVLAPEEVRDAQMSALQRKYLPELKLITASVAAHSFPYHFSFSRTLDLSEKEQQRTDQRSVQFDRYRDQVVLKITGNYFAAYSAELMTPEERARKTYQDVMLPLLRASVSALGNADAPQAFAFEISHHVMRKMLGVSTESVENVVLILPRDSAQRLVTATAPAAQEAAALEGDAFLNAQPISLWPRPPVVTTQLQSVTRKPDIAAAAAPAPSVSPALSRDAGLHPAAAAGLLAKQPVTPVEVPPAPAAPLVRDASPDALRKLQESYQKDLDRMLQELRSQANFVPYAPPAFIPFHGGVYLQLSVTTTLPGTVNGSQYALAALAFDKHVAHLIRPVLAYFANKQDFDGIDFSTSVRRAGDQPTEGSSVAVEFIFPLSLLHSYARFDYTGQQLIDAGFILINGERISLNLQMAEADTSTGR